MIQIEMPKACKGCDVAETFLRATRLPPSDKWGEYEDGFLRMRYTCMQEGMRTCNRILAFKEMEAWTDETD